MVVLLLAVLTLIGNKLLSQDVPITFRIENVESYLGDPVTTPWMFDNDDPGFITHDGNPFTYSPVGFYFHHNYAYKYFYSTSLVRPPNNPAKPYDSYCIEENLAYVDGVGGFRVEFDDYILTGVNKVNTENPGAPWNTIGESGDSRVYTGGTGRIYYNDGDGEDLVLTVENCVLRVLVHNPSALQMQIYFPAWQNNVGTGAGAFAEGWGIVNPALSDPAWVNTFADAEVDNRVEFLMSSFDHVIQNLYGYYSFDFGLRAAQNALNQGNALVPLGFVDPQLIDFPLLDVNFSFTDLVGGGPLADQSNLDVFLFLTAPDAAFPEASIPAAIKKWISQYWQFTTTLSSFNTSIVFDLTGLNFGDSDLWQILRKRTFSDEWELWGDITILDDNRIRANNVSGFSEWTVGSTEDNTLPVVLSSFTATYDAEAFVNLAWTTQSEANVSGYYVYRNQSTEYNTALLVSNLIEGTNTSNQHSYNFSDLDVEPDLTYYYWLSQEDLSGENTVYGPVSIVTHASPDPNDITIPEIITTIRNVFPNPGRNMSIDFTLAKTANISMTITNLRGQLVKHIYQGTKEIGEHHLYWDGTTDKGIRCASGIYFVEMRGAKAEPIRKKILLIK